MALTTDRETQNRSGEIINLPVAAATLLPGGGLNAINAAGAVVPAADAAGLKVIGVSDENVDNSSGAAGDKTVNSRRGRVFKFKNDGTNAVAAAHLFTNVYVKDNETVDSDGGTNSIVAGKCIGIDSDGVWVEI